MKFLAVLVALCFVGCGNGVDEKVWPWSRDYKLEPGDSLELDSSFRPDEVTALTDAASQESLSIRAGSTWHVVRGRPSFGNMGPNDHAGWSNQLSTMWIDGDALTPTEEHDVFAAMLESIESQ